MSNILKVFLSVFFLSLNLSINSANIAYAQNQDESQKTVQQAVQEIEDTKIFIATVVDAAEVDEISKTKESNSQLVTLEVDVETPAGIRKDSIETTFVFPNAQFKKPLVVGDKVLIESTQYLAPGSPITFISYYRQENMFVWAIILLGLFFIVSGARNNIKFIQILLIFLVSGLIVIFFYRRSTYLTFGGLFLWQIIATYFYAYRTFLKNTPALVLTLSIFVNQLLALIIAFAMRSIHIFDVGLFDLFFYTINDARVVMMYVFALLVIYPISVVFAEQLLKEGIKKKKEDNYISRINLMKHIASVILKSLNHIFLTLFGLFFAIFISVVALGSNEEYFLQAVNNSSLSQMLSIGFLILFNIVVFVPMVSAFVGIFLGRVEPHEIVTDRNLKQLEL
jgi:hypothetical protein